MSDLFHQDYPPTLRKRNKTVTRIKCRIGFHHYAGCGWAERMCIWCLRREVHLYSDGTAEWVKQDD